MIELELKAVVDDYDGVVRRLTDAGAREVFRGVLTDWRLDFDAGDLVARDEVLRLRVYRDMTGATTASLDWKGPSSNHGGYKRREEISVEAGDERVLMEILGRIGLTVVRMIDRVIHQFTIDGATVRLEHYQAMDDLVEVEGDPGAIERAIAVLGMPRSAFTADSLAAFAERFTARTGRPARTGSMH